MLNGEKDNLVEVGDQHAAGRGSELHSRAEKELASCEWASLSIATGVTSR